MEGPVPELCPVWAPLLGFLGAMCGLVFSSIGAAWGTGKAGQAISAIGVKRPEVRERRARNSRAPRASRARCSRFHKLSLSARRRPLMMSAF